jgi:ABC-type amino acid transport substrate-binding protein
MTAPAELAPGGTLRVGINLGNPVIAQRDPAGGDPKGVGAALGRELAKRAGVRQAISPTSSRRPRPRGSSHGRESPRSAASSSSPW